MRLFGEAAVTDPVIKQLTKIRGDDLMPHIKIDIHNEENDHIKKKVSCKLADFN